MAVLVVSLSGGVIILVSFLQVSMLTGSVDDDVPQRDLHEPIIDDFCFMEPPYGTVSKLLNLFGEI